MIKVGSTIGVRCHQLRDAAAAACSASSRSRARPRKCLTVDDPVFFFFFFFFLTSDNVVIGADPRAPHSFIACRSIPPFVVLVLEAGVSGETIPASSRRAAGCLSWVRLYDWGYATEPEPCLDGRRIAVPRGKAFGGSSAINAMVHIRGSRACFDSWRAAGNPGWGYDELNRSSHVPSADRV